MRAPARAAAAVASLHLAALGIAAVLASFPCGRAFLHLQPHVVAVAPPNKILHQQQHLAPRKRSLVVRSRRGDEGGATASEAQEASPFEFRKRARRSDEMRNRRRKLDQKDAKNAPSLAKWLSYIDSKDGGATRREAVQFFGGASAITAIFYTLENAVRGSTAQDEMCDANGMPLAGTGSKQARRSAAAGPEYFGSPRQFQGAVYKLKQAKIDLNSARAYISDDTGEASKKILRSKALQPTRFAKTCVVLEGMTPASKRLGMQTTCNTAMDSLEALRAAAQSGNASDLQKRARALDSDLSDLVKAVLQR